MPSRLWPQLLLKKYKTYAYFDMTAWENALKIAEILGSQVNKYIWGLFNI